MTAEIALGAARAARPSVPWALARLESRRHLRNPVLWLGVAASAYAAWRSSTIEWNGGTYSAFPVDLVPAAWALFVLGVTAGGRDHLAGLRPSPAVAVASGRDRIAAGRLLGLLPPLAVVAGVVAALVAASRVSGGHSIGELTWRTDSAHHTLPEIAQPILLAAMCAAAGVALGRAVRHTITAVAAGTLVLFAFGLISWAWQWTPAVYLAPVQLQPFSVDVVGPDAARADWWLASPDQYESGWRRLVVDRSVAVGHDLVLLGATAAFVGWAVRRTVGLSLAGVGAALVVAGVALQVVTGPW